MIRFIILVSIGTIVCANPYFSNYPFGLESLFATKREVPVTHKEKDRPVCETEECKVIAQMIKRSIDESKDPCDDFYDYACGFWAANDSRAENATSLWSSMENMVEKEIKDILQSPIEPDDIFAVRLAKNWYKTCMQQDKQDTGLESIVATLWRHGGWPIIMEEGEWDGRIYTWQIVDDQFARLWGSNSLHDIMYHQLTWDGNETILIDTPHLPIGVYRFLSESYQGYDASDENNESGEGSQEKGSKEKKLPGSNDENEEEEEEEEEENSVEEVPEEELRSRKVSRKRNHKRLGHKRSSSTHVGRRHKNGRRRTKRDLVQELVLRKIGALRPHFAHKSRKTTGKSSRHGHVTLNRHTKKSTGKNGLKHKEEKKTHVKKSEKKHAGHKTGRRRKEDEEDMKKKHHGSVRNGRNKRAGGKTVMHASHHDKHRRISHHHVSRKAKADEDDENNEENNEINEENNDDNEEKNEEEDEEDKPDDEEEDKKDDDEDDEPTKEEYIERYKQYVLAVVKEHQKLRGISLPEEKLKKDVDDLVEFIVKLGEITFVDYDLQNTTIDGFQETYNALKSKTKNSKVSWKKKIVKLFAEAGVEIEEDVEMTVLQPEYFTQLQKLLDETPGEVVVNYIHWLFVDKMAPLVSKQVRELSTGWTKRKLTNQNVDCSLYEMSEIVGYEFTRKRFSGKIESVARDMIDDIQKEVEYQIKESTWMDDDTKHFILDKLVHMENLVGYPDWYRNTTLVKQYFRGLTISPSYYENVLNYVRYQKWKMLRRILHSDDMPELTVDPLMVNAFFMPTENLIAISAADLQDPFFSLNRPWSVNYGIIGLVMGHEVNHGFDDSGHLYDRTGKPMEWLSAMASAYNERAGCFVRQFNQYDLVKGENFTVENYGNNTAGENIADTMGLHAVFKAYQRRLRECSKPDPALPGLEKFDNNQTFFLAFANLWCDTEDPEMVKMYAEYDVHSTGRLRVIGSVSNSDDFAKAFNCPAGSPMNPEKKCNIWL